MKAYRLKHTPTGLYYKPGNPNFSKRGKVYFGSSNRLTYSQGPVICIVKRNSAAHKLLMTVEDITWGKPRYDEEIAYIPKKQFCIEPLNSNL